MSCHDFLFVGKAMKQYALPFSMCPCGGFWIWGFLPPGTTTGLIRDGPSIRCTRTGLACIPTSHTTTGSREFRKKSAFKRNLSGPLSVGICLRFLRQRTISFGIVKKKIRTDCFLEDARIFFFPFSKTVCEMKQ